MSKHSTEKEIWRGISGWEEEYQVSNLGRVKSFKRGVRILRPAADSDGYLQVRPCRNGKGKLIFVHKLVALTFIPNPSDKPEVNHKDGVRTNNESSNLEWVTHKEQMEHAWKLTSALRGSRHGKAKLTENDIPKIRRRIGDGESQESIAVSLGVKPGTISAVHLGKSWGHIK